MTHLLKIFKKKFTLACMFWTTGSILAFTADSNLGEYTAFTAVVLTLFKVSDVVDKHLNGGDYDEETT